MSSSLAKTYFVTEIPKKLKKEELTRAMITRNNKWPLLLINLAVSVIFSKCFPLQNSLSGAHEIKKWLIQCAGLIAGTSNPVSWITPLGLPIVQPYRSKSQMDVIYTIIQKVTISNNADNLPINKTKQRSAFPPNYIHSLDSTHLMYTALECRKENITFAAVHDSYWTHAGTIERMNELLRDQFIKLHGQPLLENLKDSFERRYPQITFPDIPTRGDFDLENIKNSIYFFA